MSDVAERNWRDRPIYWVIVAGLISAIAAVLGLWFLADATIRRDIPYPEVTEVGAIIFNCEPEHRIGAQVWIKTDMPPKGYPIIEGRVCFDVSKRQWYVKSREQYVLPGRESY